MRPAESNLAAFAVGSSLDGTDSRESIRLDIRLENSCDLRIRLDSEDAALLSGEASQEKRVRADIGPTSKMTIPDFTFCASYSAICGSWFSRRRS